MEEATITEHSLIDDHQCTTCGVPLSAVAGIEVVVHSLDGNVDPDVVCADTCITTDMQVIPADDEYLFIPEHAFNDAVIQPVPVSIDAEVTVVQIRTEWDSPTDGFMYEFADMDEHLDEVSE